MGRHVGALLALLALCGGVGVAFGAPSPANTTSSPPERSFLKVKCAKHDNAWDDIYYYSASDIKGEKTIYLDQYEGKVVLIVNTATY